MFISKDRFFTMWILAAIVLIILGTCQLVKAADSVIVDGSEYSCVDGEAAGRKAMFNVIRAHANETIDIMQPLLLSKNPATYSKFLSTVLPLYEIYVDDVVVVMDKIVRRCGKKMPPLDKVKKVMMQSILQKMDVTYANYLNQWAIIHNK